MSERADFSDKLPYDGRPAATPDDSDAKSEPSSQETGLEADPTEGAPWRWRIIAMLFALSLAGKSSNILDASVDLATWSSWQQFLRGDFGTAEKHPCQGASYYQYVCKPALSANPNSGS
jgi:hypothetical protein